MHQAQHRPADMAYSSHLVRRSANGLVQSSLQLTKLVFCAWLFAASLSSTKPADAASPLAAAEELAHSLYYGDGLPTAASSSVEEHSQYPGTSFG